MHGIIIDQDTTTTMYAYKLQQQLIEQQPMGMHGIVTDQDTTTTMDGYKLQLQLQQKDQDTTKYLSDGYKLQQPQSDGYNLQQPRSDGYKLQQL